MGDDKSPKKEKKKDKKKALDGDVSMASIAVEDVEMDEGKSEKKPKKEKEEIVLDPSEHSPICQPLAQKKLVKKLHKTIKKASKQRQVKRGVKEIVKGIRKGDKGLLVLAADITPIDIISHLPVLSEEAQIPFVFVGSKEELGQASSTKRPTSCVMVCPSMKAKKRKIEGDAEKDDEKDDYRELYDECFQEVQKLDTKILY